VLGVVMMGYFFCFRLSFGVVCVVLFGVGAVFTSDGEIDRLVSDGIDL
jgi:type IV secretory pathway VirB2 component (pilin)